MKNIMDIQKLVKQYDYDRYICTIFAPQAFRDELFSLYAFNCEVARIRETVDEAIAGLIRLQWWRESIEDLYKGNIRNHFILNNLAYIIEKRNLNKQLFLQVLEEREFDLQGEPPRNLSALIKYIEGTSGNIFELASRITTEKEGILSQSRALGISWALIGIIRSLKHCNTSKRPIMLPKNLLDKQNLSHEDILNGYNLEASIPIIKTLSDLAEQYLEQLKSNTIPSENKFLFLPFHILKQIIHNIKKYEYDIYNKAIEYTKFYMLLQLLFKRQRI